MTVKLGMFTMPFHHPDRDYAAILEEAREAIVLADRLGFTEAFVGEHFSSWSERITSPLIFFATLIPRTTQIRFGTGVINLPQLHPATVAAHAAMFDQLCRGRFIMGIGPGGLVRDLEMFDVGQAELRPQMVIESIETVLKLWAQHPPYEIDGRFFHHSFSKGRKALFMLKPDLLIPDEDVTEDMIKRALVIAGSPRRVLEQLVALREETGHFGTLLMGGHDWDRPALWRRSMELLATDVMPKFSQHASAPRP